MTGSWVCIPLSQIRGSKLHARVSHPLLSPSVTRASRGLPSARGQPCGGVSVAAAPGPSHQVPVGIWVVVWFVVLTFPAVSVQVDACGAAGLRWTRVAGLPVAEFPSVTGRPLKAALDLTGNETLEQRLGGGGGRAIWEPSYPTPATPRQGLEPQDLLSNLQVLRFRPLQSSSMFFIFKFANCWRLILRYSCI